MSTVVLNLSAPDGLRFLDVSRRVDAASGLSLDFPGFTSVQEFALRARALFDISADSRVGVVFALAAFASDEEWASVAAVLRTLTPAAPDLTESVATADGRRRDPKWVAAVVGEAHSMRGAS